MSTTCLCFLPHLFLAAHGWEPQSRGLTYPFPFVGLLTETDLGSRAWIRIEGRLVRGSDPHSQLEHILYHRDMGPQYATVDQLIEITDTMASLRDAILGLGQRIDGHQAQPLQIPGSTSLDSIAPPS
ncbi:hypothetical protein CK203_065625 [Vitis vinifera]|uniref:Uncharacterized protein n=1 Tax=Vitis vinifera TaxID=29760 RepID=A0A438FP48_VITVI|nr:hypothetical protein CK203_065625 [Vitis vinifera]